ncbi:hypothetical protein PUN28_005939 [Cardiocondyla obscurior]|uniref:Uncharacterized protein n=1 Tax=Cardiocondyla obscurior TaxID=286306 RepID=A0AAW2G852_9HYME
MTIFVEMPVIYVTGKRRKSHKKYLAARNKATPKCDQYHDIHYSAIISIKVKRCKISKRVLYRPDEKFFRIYAGFSNVENFDPEGNQYKAVIAFFLALFSYCHQGQRRARGKGERGL